MHGSSKIQILNVKSLLGGSPKPHINTRGRLSIHSRSLDDMLIRPSVLVGCPVLPLLRPSIATPKLWSTPLTKHSQLDQSPAFARLSLKSRHFSTSSQNMAPTPKEYDYIVIGGGSGGSGAARRASGWYKKKTCIIDDGISGGCCVNVG